MNPTNPTRNLAADLAWARRQHAAYLGRAWYYTRALSFDGRPLEQAAFAPRDPEWALGRPGERELTFQALDSAAAWRAVLARIKAEMREAAR